MRRTDAHCGELSVTVWLSGLREPEKTFTGDAPVRIGGPVARSGSPEAVDLGATRQTISKLAATLVDTGDLNQTYARPKRDRRT